MISWLDSFFSPLHCFTTSQLVVHESLCVLSFAVPVVLVAAVPDHVRHDAEERKLLVELLIDTWHQIRKQFRGILQIFKTDTLQGENSGLYTYYVLKKPSQGLWRFSGCVFRSAWGWLSECQQTHPIWSGKVFLVTPCKQTCSSPSCPAAWAGQRESRIFQHYPNILLSLCPAQAEGHARELHVCL